LGGVALERQVVTISKGIEVLEHEGQRVLINPVNREWIKLADYAYDLALNPEGKPVSRLIADEALRSGAEPEIIRALFQYLKEYRFVAEVSDVVTLARAYLNVTARCNLTCPMCYFADNDLPGHAESSSELSYEALCLTIDALAKTDLSNLVISGGEPLLYQDFCRILNYAKEKISRITILTNGTLTTKEYAEHISKANARVQVSIESANSRVHDSIRGRGSFDKAIEGIKMLLHAGVDDIEIVQTLTRESISESESVVKLAGKLGVGYHFSLFLPVGRGTCHIGDLEIPATPEMPRGNDPSSNDGTATAMKITVMTSHTAWTGYAKWFLRPLFSSARRIAAAVMQYPQPFFAEIVPPDVCGFVHGVYNLEKNPFKPRGRLGLTISRPTHLRDQPLHGIDCHCLTLVENTNVAGELLSFIHLMSGDNNRASLFCCNFTKKLPYLIPGRDIQPECRFIQYQ
jgi:organic radical activating enzyme